MMGRRYGLLVRHSDDPEAWHFGYDAPGGVHDRYEQPSVLIKIRPYSCSPSKFVRTEDGVGIDPLFCAYRDVSVSVKRRLPRMSLLAAKVGPWAPPGFILKVKGSRDLRRSGYQPNTSNKQTNKQRESPPTEADKRGWWHSVNLRLVIGPSQAQK